MIKKIGIIMNGVTGRMGTNQHLVRSVLSIKDDGGILLSNGDYLIPEPVLVGRNKKKLEQLAEMYSIKQYTTKLDDALSDSSNAIYFDSQTTNMRMEGALKAIDAGKAVYCEKPIAVNTNDALALYKTAKKKKIKNGVVQDKLWLAGIVKLKHLIDTDFFGEILAVRGEFGYWVFDGKDIPMQRPSWNYRKEEGGGIIIDMFCHWQYVIDNLFGQIDSLTCLGAMHIKERVNENGEIFTCTAEDAAYATFELKNGIICHFNSSWDVRVRRDDLLTIQVDGTKGSALAGLRECWIQPSASTPKPVWNPDIPSPLNYFDNWQKVPDYDTYPNAFKAQWILFLKHIAEDKPFRWNLLEGAKGVQLAEIGLQSWRERKWVKVPELSLEND